MEQTSIQRIVNDNPDSIELGTPSKQGAVKVYGNFENKEAFKIKIDNALEMREYINKKFQNI